MLAAIIVFGLQQGTFDLTTIGHEPTRRGSSSASSSRSRSRRRSSRSTAGCRTPTARRRPRWRRCSRASSRRRPSTASCASRSRSSPRPTHDWRVRPPRARGDRRSSTARCSPSARPTSAASSRTRRSAQIGPDRARPLRRQRPRLRRRRAADGQPRADLGVALPARRHGRAAHRRPASSRGSAAWRAGGPIARHPPDDDRRSSRSPCRSRRSSPVSS